MCNSYETNSPFIIKWLLNYLTSNYALLFVFLLKKKRKIQKMN